MDTIKTITVTSVMITPDSRMESVRLTLDCPTLSMKIIGENMKNKYQCTRFRSYVAKAVYPDQSFYYAYFESDVETPDKKFNKIASQIITNQYNSDAEYNPTGASLKCYGNCYILHIDPLCNVYDVGTETFVRLYNKVHTPGYKNSQNSFEGIKERDHSTRIYKRADKDKYYIEGDYLVARKKHGNCGVM